MKIKPSIILILILIIALFIRWYNLKNLGLVGDEKPSSSIALGIDMTNLPKTPTVFFPSDLKKYNTLENTFHGVLNGDNGNALSYSILLRYWASLVGFSDIKLKLMSILFGLLIIILTYKITLHLSNNHYSSLFASFLLAVHPILIRFSLEIRSYNVGIFFTLLSTYILLKLFERANSFHTIKKTFYLILAYSICILTALLSHYHTIYVFGGHALFALLNVKNKKFLKYFLLSSSMIFVVFAFWMFQYGFSGLKDMSSVNENVTNEIKNQGSSNQANYQQNVLPANISTVANLSIYNTSELLMLNGLYAIIKVRYIILFIMLSAFIIGTNFYKNKKSSILFLPLSIFIVYFLFTLLIAIKSGHTIPFKIRYASFSAPYLIILVVIGIFNALQPPLLKRISLVTSALIIFGIIVSWYLLNPTLIGIEKRENPHCKAALLIRNTYTASDTVIYPSSSDANFTNLYFNSDEKIIQTIDSLKTDKKIIIKNNNRLIEIIDMSSYDEYGIKITTRE